MKELKAFPLIISDSNYALTRGKLTIDDYLIFRNSELNNEIKVEDQQ
jgi:hypothetical protein